MTQREWEASTTEEPCVVIGYERFFCIAGIGSHSPVDYYGETLSPRISWKVEKRKSVHPGKRANAH